MRHVEFRVVEFVPQARVPVVDGVSAVLRSCPPLSPIASLFPQSASMSPSLSPLFLFVVGSLILQFSLHSVLLALLNALSCV